MEYLLLNALVEADEPRHLGRIPGGSIRIARIARDGESGKFTSCRRDVHGVTQ